MSQGASAQDRLAVLIDADNAQASLIEPLLAEIAKYGTASVKRIYGDWTTPNLGSWKSTLLEHSIQPIQQFRYTVGKNATDSAMRDIMRIVNDYKSGGMTADELAFTKNSIGQSDARNYESGFQKAGFLSRILDYHLPADYPKQQNDMLAKMTLDEVNGVNQQKLPPMNQMNVLLVGDKAKVWDSLQNLGYEVVELDADGNPVQ